MKLIENSSNDIDSAAKDLAIGIFMTNYYFDTSDYSQPLKVDVSTQYEYSSIQGFERTINIKIRRNLVQDTTSYLPFASSKEYTYFSIGQDSKDIVYDSKNLAVFSIKFEIDNMYQTIQRQVFSISDVFGKAGGMDTILCIFASFLVGIFSSDMYKASLISNFYDVISSNSLFSINQNKMPEEEKEMHAVDKNKNTKVSIDDIISKSLQRQKKFKRNSIILHNEEILLNFSFYIFKVNKSYFKI